MAAFPIEKKEERIINLFFISGGVSSTALIKNELIFIFAIN